MKSYIYLYLFIALFFSGCGSYKNFMIINDDFYPSKHNKNEFSLRKDYEMFELEAYCQRKTNCREFYVYLIIHNDSDDLLMVEMVYTAFWPQENDAPLLVEVNNQKSITKYARIPANSTTTIRLVSEIKAGFYEIPVAQIVYVKNIKVTDERTLEEIELETLEFKYIPDKDM
ncbi:MAG: hypothetical protein R3F48_01140 [Candidatus Zixiibacteriota bacterium]